MENLREPVSVVQDEKDTMETVTTHNSSTGEEGTSTLAIKETAREARMRRLANKHGLRLHKSRRDIDKGMYSLIDAYRNLVVFGYNSNLGCCEATLDEVEEYLKEGE